MTESSFGASGSLFLQLSQLLVELCKRAFKLCPVAFAARRFQETGDSRARQSQRLGARVALAILRREPRFDLGIPVSFGIVHLVFDGLAFPSTRHFNYFNLAPFGTSSANVAITGFPSSPTEAANNIPCDS
jgi:hypothetical protein